MDNNMSKDKPGHGLSVAGLVLGILAVVFCWIPIVNWLSVIMGILAIVFGIVGVVKKNGGLAIAALILGVIGFGFAAYMKFAVTKGVMDAANNTAKNAKVTVDDASGDNTDSILKNDIDVQLGSFSATTDEYGLNTTELPVHVTNKNSDSKSYTLQIEATDANGDRIDDDTVYVNNLGGNQSQDFKAFQFVSSDKLEQMKTATFKVSNATKI